MFTTKKTLLKNLLFLTENHLSNVQISNENIIKIINNLDPNIAHGHDMVSIRMLKLCGLSLCKPFSIIFKSCFSQIKFLMEWKKKQCGSDPHKKLIISASKTTERL